MESDGKLRMLRILELLRNETDEQHPLSTAQIERILRERWGLEAYRITIQKDIAALVAAGYEIETIRSTQNKYYFSGRLFELPELKLLIDAVESSKFITEKKSRVLTEKLTTLAGRSEAGQLRRNISIADRIKAGNEQIYYILDALNDAISKASYGEGHFHTPAEKVNTYAIKFITLAVQAAIRGGVAPVIAYSVGDNYEAAVAAAKTTADKKHLMDTMFIDFVNRVRHIKGRTDISKPIRTCCDYIQLHIYEQIKLEDIGKLVGYTKYYLSRKFKAEMGISIWDYINECKVEEAKSLLMDPTLTIQDVSDRLNYCSRSYFSEVFQSCTGMWPSNYRAIELKM